MLTLPDNISLSGQLCPLRNIRTHPSKDPAKAENVLAGRQSGI